jgi:hypothetical protein
MAGRIAAIGHRVEVLTQTPDRTLPRFETRAGVTVRRFVSIPGNRHLTAAPALLSFLCAERHHYDIVHVSNVPHRARRFQGVCGGSTREEVRPSAVSGRRRARFAD